MIVTRREGRFELVTQPDHARLASQILALWREPPLVHHPRREELLLATREHDNGWREADAAPRADPETGAPLDFRRFPRRDRIELWHRAVERLRSSPYAAALVANHAVEIHRERSHPDWAGFRREMSVLRDELLAETGIDLADLELDYVWLELADLVSLTACGALDELQRVGGYNLRATDRGVEVDPFPLAGATTFEVMTRQIPLGFYDTDLEVAARAGEAVWRRRRIRLTARA